MSFTLVFEECVGVHKDDCIDIINQHLAENPELFENRDSLNYEVSKVRENTDTGYNLVGLRTNMAETGVVGILGDGMVWYPWEWCLPNGHCYTVGPWDCDVGTPLNVDECCNMIKATVPDADVNGNTIDCYADYPVGSVSNPVDYGRVSIPVNANNIVVRPPRNE